MLWQYLFLIFTKSVLSEVTEKPEIIPSGTEKVGIIPEGSQESGIKVAQMMGVDTIHNSKSPVIDKDTIITMTRELKVERRGKGKSTKNLEMKTPTSYSSVPESIRGYVEDFKMNMTECLKEVQEKDNRPVRRLSPKIESPVHGECLIACVLKRNGVIQNKKVNKDNLIALVSKFFGKDTKLMKKLEKNVDRCIEMSAHHKDECHLASRLNDCTNDLMVANKHHVTVNY